MIGDNKYGSIGGMRIFGVLEMVNSKCQGMSVESFSQLILPLSEQ
jgi:hypothetical protein